MLFVIALRNVKRNMGRLMPVIIVLVLGFCLLLVANSILYSVNVASSQGFKTSITGDVSLSHPDMDDFTLLGPNSLLSGEYLQPKTIPFANELGTFLTNESVVAGFVGVTTIPCMVDLHATEEQKKSLQAYYDFYKNQGILVEHHPELYYSDAHPVVGIDFSVALRTLPGLELVAGSFPPPGKPGFIVQESVFNAMSLWFDPLQGIFRFTSNVNNSSFSIRELPLYGVFRLPLSDRALAPLILADSNSVRDLAGLRLALDSMASIEKNASAMLEIEIDDLFGQDYAMTTEKKEDTVNHVDGIAELFDTQEGVNDASSELIVDTGPWHFILIRLVENARPTDLKKALKEQGFLVGSDILVRDWRGTIGGSAMLVYVLQLVLNIGALFVILGVLLLATNAMMLSVFERSSEFAVMRAMGASRRFVFALVIQESFMLVFGSAFLGLFLGAMASLLLNALYIEVANPYIVMLLGSNSIHSTLKLGLFLLHALGAMCIAIVASVFPVRKVLVIQPSRAMA